MSDGITVAPATHEEFMAHACALEDEASGRYAELAEQMLAHHNGEVALLFAKLARIEGKHRDQILAEMGWSRVPDGEFRWETPEGPETTDYGDLHYLMKPRHALELALHNERRAAAFFAQLAGADVPAHIREMAEEMAAEEREHVRLIEEWLATVPDIDAGWDEDLDPPNAVD